MQNLVEKMSVAESVVPSCSRNVCVQADVASTFDAHRIGKSIAINLEDQLCELTPKHI